MTTTLNMRQFTPEMEQIYFEARRHCDKHGIEGEDGLRQVMGAMAHKAFLAAIEPFIKMKCRITALHIPHCVLHADGSFESTPQKLSNEEQKAWDRLDELIENERRRYSPAA